MVDFLETFFTADFLRLRLWQTFSGLAIQIPTNGRLSRDFVYGRLFRAALTADLWGGCADGRQSLPLAQPPLGGGVDIHTVDTLSSLFQFRTHFLVRFVPNKLPLPLAHYMVLNDM